MFDFLFKIPVVIRRCKPEEPGKYTERRARAMTMSLSAERRPESVIATAKVFLIRASFEIQPGDLLVTTDGEFELGAVQHCFHFDGRTAAYRCTLV